MTYVSEVDEHSNPNSAKQKVQERMDALMRTVDPVEDKTGKVVSNSDEFSVQDSAYLESIGVTDPTSLTTPPKPRRPKAKRRDLRPSQELDQDDWSDPDQQIVTNRASTGGYESPQGLNVTMDERGWATAPPPQALHYDSKAPNPQGSSSTMPVKQDRKPELDRTETVNQENTRIRSDSPFDANRSEVTWSGKDNVTRGVDPSQRESEGRMTVPIPPGAVRKRYSRRRLDSSPKKGRVEPDEIIISEGNAPRPIQRVHGVRDLRAGRRNPRSSYAQQPSQQPPQQRLVRQTVPNVEPPIRKPAQSKPTGKRNPTAKNVEQEELW